MEVLPAHGLQLKLWCVFLICCPYMLLWTISFDPNSLLGNMSGDFRDNCLLPLGAASGEKGSRTSGIVDALLPGQRFSHFDRALVGEENRQSIRACKGMTHGGCTIRGKNKLDNRMGI